MTDGFVTFFADGNELSMFLPIYPGKSVAKSQLRMLLQVLDMVNQHSPSISSLFLALLAFIVILPQNLQAFVSPG